MTRHLLPDQHNEDGFGSVTLLASHREIPGGTPSTQHVMELGMGQQGIWAESRAFRTASFVVLPKPWLGLPLLFHSPFH